jgi:DNA-directed RNA polymerase specialized sigma subunit
MVILMMTTNEMGTLVAANMTLIRATVRKAALRCGQSITDDDETDIAQDAVLALLDGKLARYDATRGAAITSFIVTCVRNFVVDHFRTTHFMGSYDTTEAGRDEEGENGAYVAQSSDNPERHAIRNESARMLRAALTTGEASDLGAFLSPDYSEDDYATGNAITVNAARARKSRLLSKVNALVK